jgi:hypothetical protein
MIKAAHVNARAQAMRAGPKLEYRMEKRRRTISSVRRNLESAAVEPHLFTLSFDAHTLGVIAPRYYSVKRAHIPGSGPCTDYYAVSAPDRPDRAWATSAEDGTRAPSVLWAVQNALNCEFPGSAAEGRTLMRQWLTGLGKRFIGACAERSITRAELVAIAANRLSAAS